MKVLTDMRLSECLSMRRETQAEEHREQIGTVWRVLLDIVEIVSEENPKLLRRLERLGIHYGRAWSFRLLISKTEIEHKKKEVGGSSPPRPALVD